MGGDDLRDLPLSLRKTNLARLLARRPGGIFISPFEEGEIGPDLFRKACEFGLEGLVSYLGMQTVRTITGKDRMAGSAIFAEIRLRWQSSSATCRCLLAACTDECPVMQMADIESAATTLSSRPIEGLGQGREQRPCQSDVSQPIDIFDLARIAHVGLPHSPDNCFGAMPTKQRSL
jgi:hypothetical protein